MCCTHACCDIPSRRYSVAVVHPVSGEVEFHWLFAYAHRVSHVPLWPFRKVERREPHYDDTDWESDGEN